MLPSFLYLLLLSSFFGSAPIFSFSPSFSTSWCCPLSTLLLLPSSSSLSFYPASSILLGYLYPSSSILLGYFFIPSSILLGHLCPASSTSSLPTRSPPPVHLLPHLPTFQPLFSPFKPPSPGATLCLRSSYYLLLLAYPSTLSFFHPARAPLPSFFYLLPHPFSCFHIYPPSSPSLSPFHLSFSPSSCFAFTSRILGENN